jgi:hypothetical protein
MYSTPAFGSRFFSQGGMEAVVDLTVQCFTNHGCNGSANFGYGLSLTEANADPETMGEEILEHYCREQESVYNPAADRAPHFYGLGSPLRDIVQGEEIYINYFAFVTADISTWPEEVEDLTSMCAGTTVGGVVEYERAKASKQATTNNSHMSL